jgi:hypothetical protein
MVGRTVRTTRVPFTPCTNCGRENDSASRLDDDYDPHPGDVAICFKCHHLMVFADDMTMRDPTDAEVLEIAGDEDVVRHMKALGRARRLERLARAARR